MAKRFTIGLNYFFNNQSNSGIVNYIYNIVSALKTLEDVKKPQLIVFHSESAPIDYLREIEYPYIKFVLFSPHPENFLIRKANSALRRVFNLDIYKRWNYFDNIDCLYPYFEFQDHDFIHAKRKIHWLVDFNNRAYPEYYQDKGESMRLSQDKITLSKDRIVLSSYSLLNELKQYYPSYTCEVKVLRFASTLPDISRSDINQLLHNYHIEVPFFMSPNQFWEHKNQSIVLDALYLIKKQNPQLKFKVLFSGSLDVNRGRGLYIDKLNKKIQQYHLEEYISFLGILERKEQLLLMKHAVSLLQPSLYEGWSTLVEEAKALGQYIILSDITVHREQIDQNVAFFNPLDAEDLATKMIKQLEQPSEVQQTNYKENIKEFGEKIIDAFK